LPEPLTDAAQERPAGTATAQAPLCPALLESANR